MRIPHARVICDKKTGSQSWQRNEHHLNQKRTHWDVASNQWCPTWGSGIDKIWVGFCRKCRILTMIVCEAGSVNACGLLLVAAFSVTEKPYKALHKLWATCTPASTYLVSSRLRRRPILLLSVSITFFSCFLVRFLYCRHWASLFS